MGLTVYNIFEMMGAASLVITAAKYFAKKENNFLIGFLQNFVGCLFIFSGFVKAVDPMGTSFKMHEYFEAMHIDFLNVTSTAMSVLMITAEIALGVALLIGWKPKLTTSLLLLLNVFFLLLTGFTYISGYSPTTLFFIVSVLAFALISLGAIVEKSTLRMISLSAGFFLILATLLLMKFSSVFLTSSFKLENMKVTDCGCFGDFIKLKPWETFYKDVILTTISLVLILNYSKIKSLFSILSRSVLAYGSLIAAFIFCIYNFVWSEPVIDFRPYAVGSDLNKNRIAEKPEKKDFVFVYTNLKTGKDKEFKTAELTALTEDWKYKDRKDIVLEEGIPARISNLNIFDENHEEITDSLLHDPNYSLAVIAYKLSNTDADYFTTSLNPMAAAAEKVGIPLYVITSDASEQFRHKYQTAYPFYTADETPLKTMLRSNPGLLLLKNGVVVNKWHRKSFPSFDELNTRYFKK